MRTTYISLISLLILPIVSCHQVSTTPARRILFEEDFNSYANGANLPAGFWSEGSKAVRIEKGRLRADANLDGSGENYGTSTIWRQR